MKAVGVVLILLLLFPPSISAQSTAKLTLLEGSVRVIRGTTVFRGIEGIELRQGDMLESSEGGFVQFEFPGGTIVALGPSTKVFLYRLGATPRSARSRQGPSGNLVLLTGWLKGESNPESGTYRYSTPSITVATVNGAVIFHLDSEGCDANIEAGSAGVGETSSDGSWQQTASAKAGQFLSKRAGKNLTTSTLPSEAFVKAMPQAFKDTLPPRTAHFQGKKPLEPKPDHPVVYADLQPWLTLPIAWRQGFVERFEPLLHDRDFRREIGAHLAQYPEWDPILHPEKYRQENPPPANNPGKPNEVKP
jgi:hypothetical protein